MYWPRRSPSVQALSIRIRGLSASGLTSPTRSAVASPHRDPVRTSVSMSGDSGRECRTGALATRRRSARDRCACPQGSGQRQAQDSRECLRPGAADRSPPTRPNGRSGSFLLTACQQSPTFSSPPAGLEAALSTCGHQSASQRQRASLRRGRLRVATDPASAGIRLWSGQMPGCSTPPTKGPHLARSHSTHSQGTLRP